MQIAAMSCWEESCRIRQTLSSARATNLRQPSHDFVCMKAAMTVASACSTAGDKVVCMNADSGNELLERVLSNQADTISQVLGRPIQDSRHQPSHAVVIARSAEIIGSQEASCSFEVILTQPTFKIDDAALSQVIDLTFDMRVVLGRTI